MRFCRMDGGQWTPASRNSYNLRDAVSRSTTQVKPYCLSSSYHFSAKLTKRTQLKFRVCVLCNLQVYPKSWTAIHVALDNVGMWNLRSEFWARQYLGQQLYVRVYTDSSSLRDEYPIPKNALLCGRASGHHTRPL